MKLSHVGEALKTLAIIIVIPLVVSFIFNYLTTSGFSVLRYDNPQHVFIDESSAPVVVHLGDSINVFARKCNTSNTDISIRWTSAFVRDTPSRINIANMSGIAVRHVGCQQLIFLEKIPPDLPLGDWHIEGIDRATINGQTVDVSWYTEIFTVIQ